MAHILSRHKLIQAGVAAGSAFSGALIGIAVVDMMPEGIWGAGVAALVAFFASLGGNGVADRNSS